MTRTLLLTVFAIAGLALVAPLALAHDGLHAHPHVADMLFVMLIAATVAALYFERRYSSNL
jgi:hypothetical protein